MITQVNKALLKTTSSLLLPLCVPQFAMCGSFLWVTQEKFLHKRTKLAGKTGVLQDHITIERDGSAATSTPRAKLISRNAISRSDRRLHFLNLLLATQDLTKKFLKKQLVRDYISVIARTKTGYFLRYFNFHNEEEGEAGAAGAAAE